MPPMIAVCCLTRQRPVMLTALLKSFVALNKPLNARTLFVVVENDTGPHSKAIVESELRGENFIYALEPVTGISRARNLAVEKALAAGAAAVLFVDDDEVVDADWLQHLVAAWQADRGDILGGPVRVKFTPGPKTAICRFVEKGLTQRFDRRAARKARMRVNVPVCTNNCLIDSAVFATSGLRFDVALLSGEDRELFRQALARGYRASWVPAAIVHETWPAERVNFSYFFLRAREQIKASAGPKSRTMNIIASIGLGTFALLQFLCVPITGAGGALQAVRNMGTATGYLQKALGVPARPYGDITGN